MHVKALSFRNIPLSFFARSTFGQAVILSSGSGLIINHTGVIVTNAHVVNIAATVPWRTELRVQLQNGDVYEGMVRDVDWKADIATVKVNPQVGATSPIIGRSAYRGVAGQFCGKFF